VALGEGWRVLLLVFSPAPDVDSLNLEFLLQGDVDAVAELMRPHVGKGEPRILLPLPQCLLLLLLLLPLPPLTLLKTTQVRVWRARHRRSRPTPA